MVGTDNSAQLTALGTSGAVLSNVSLLGMTGVNVRGGTAANPTRINAGVSMAGWAGALVIQDGSTIVSNGQIEIDNYRGGAGTGNVVFGNNVRMTARGGGTFGGITTTGDIAVQSSGTGSVFADGTGLNLTSYGGWIWLSGGDDLTFGNNADINSVAKLDDSGAMRFIPAAGVSIPNYFGGGIALYAGLDGVDYSTYLSGRINTRTGGNTVSWPAPPVFDRATNAYTIVGGGIFEVTLSIPTTNVANIHNNGGLASGGTIVIDPPSPGNAVIFQAMNLFALAPPIGNLPPPPTPPTPITGISTPPVDGPPGFTIPPVTTVTFTFDQGKTVLAGPTQTRDLEPLHIHILPKIYDCPAPMTLDLAERGLTKWYMDSANCQAFFMGDSEGTIMIGESGTSLSPQGQGTVDLREGRMVIITDATHLNVMTQKGMVTVPKQSSVIIEQRASGVMRVTGLSGSGATFTPGVKKPDTEEDSSALPRSDKTGSAKTGPDPSASSPGAPASRRHLTPDPKPELKPVAMTTAPGSDLVVYDADAEEEELIPVDGCDRDIVAGGKIVNVSPNVVAKQTTFKKVELAKKDSLLNCSHGCFSGYLKRQMEKLKQEMLAGAGLSISLDNNYPQVKVAQFSTPEAQAASLGSQAASPGSSATSPSAISLGAQASSLLRAASADAVSWTNQTGSAYSPAFSSSSISDDPNQSFEPDAGAYQPIAAVAPNQPPAALHTVQTDATANGTLKYSGSTKLQVTPAMINLNSGELVVAATKQTMVRSSGVIVTVSAGATAAISHREGGVTVIRNIYDIGNSSVKVTMGMKRLDVAVGSELVVGPSAQAITKVLSKDLVARRRVASSTAGRLHVTTSDISIISLLGNSEVLNQIVRSTQNDDQSLTNRILKMAACLSIVTAHRGSYNLVKGH